MQNQSSMTKPLQLNIDRESANRALLVTCSKNGYVLLQKLLDKLKKSEDFATWDFVTKVHCSGLEQISETGKLSETIDEYYDQVKAIIFICASGIAVRSIAKHVDSKKKDPAVLVMDETGKNCISLMSGHYGGANDLTQRIAKLIEANAVITTATDCEGLFSLDAFAGKNHMSISDWKLMKEYAVAVLDGKSVGLQKESWVSLDRPWPYEDNNNEKTVIISEKVQKTSEQLQLIPRCMVIGIGCRKDTSYELIRQAVNSALEQYGIHKDSVLAITSIDLKKNEEGIHELSKELDVPFVCFDAEKLKALEGDFSSSSFVEKTTGVDNVCERSAVCFANEETSQYTTIMKKTVFENVTVAMVRVEKICAL